jgi:hypothetical protein
MSGGLEIEVGLGDLSKFAALFREVGNQVPHAIRRAVNWTGDKARTVVVRTLAKQTGAKYAAVRRALVVKRATYGRAEYRLVAFGGFMSLKEFSPRQRRDGVSAKPWGRRVVFKHAFISEPMGGHVFIREGEKRIMTKGRYVGQLRQPVRKLWGPAIPREMLKGMTETAFVTLVDAELQLRIDHELRAILNGHAPRG